MRFFVRALWTISVIGFLFNLFTTYGNLQQSVGIQLADYSLMISRSGYFFFFLGFFGVLNLSLIGMGMLIPQIHKQFYFIPNASFWTSNKAHRNASDRILINWVWAIAATANYFLIFWMLVVENNFHFEGNSVSAVNWFHIPGLAMTASLLTPIIRLTIKNVNLLDRKERE